MFLSEEEVIAILKKSLPKSSYKDLEEVAKSIVNKAQDNAQEFLGEDAHDEMKKKFLRKTDYGRFSYQLDEKHRSY